MEDINSLSAEEFNQLTARLVVIVDSFDVDSQEAKDLSLAIQAMRFIITCDTTERFKQYLLKMQGKLSPAQKEHMRLLALHQGFTLEEVGLSDEDEDNN